MLRVTELIGFAGAKGDLGNDADTKLLLNFDGPDGGDTIYDISAGGGHPVLNDGATIVTANALANFGQAVEFSSGDSLKLNGHADFAFGTGDFDVEGFFRSTANNGVVRQVYESRGQGQNGAYLTLNISAGNNLTLFVNSATRISGTHTVLQNRWYHWRCQRASGTTTLYLTERNILDNGWEAQTNEGSWADSTNYIVGTNRPVIGIHSGMATNPFVGQMNDMRVSKGSVRPLSVPATPYSPTPPQAGNDANTMLLLHCDSPDGGTTFEDKSATEKTVTRLNSCAVSTDQQNGPLNQAAHMANPSSANNLLQVANHADLDWSIANWTLEMFVYRLTEGWNSFSQFAAKWGAPPDRSFALQIQSGVLNVYFSTTGSDSFNPTITLTDDVLNAWQHWAFEKEGTTFRCYIEGISQGTPATVAANFASPATSLFNLGGNLGLELQGSINGYMDEIRWRNEAVYGGTNFTPTRYPFGPDAR